MLDNQVLFRQNVLFGRNCILCRRRLINLPQEGQHRKPLIPLILLLPELTIIIITFLLTLLPISPIIPLQRLKLILLIILSIGNLLLLCIIDLYLL